MLGTWDVGHCCFCAAVSQAASLVLYSNIRQLPHPCWNNFFFLLPSKWKAGIVSFWSCSNSIHIKHMYHSLPRFLLLIHSSLQAACPRYWWKSSAVKFISVWLPAWLAGKEQGASDSLIAPQKCGLADISAFSPDIWAASGKGTATTHGTEAQVYKLPCNQG